MNILTVMPKTSYSKFYRGSSQFSHIPPTEHTHHVISINMPSLIPSTVNLLHRFRLFKTVKKRKFARKVITLHLINLLFIDVVITQNFTNTILGMLLLVMIFVALSLVLILLTLSSVLIVVALSLVLTSVSFSDAVLEIISTCSPLLFCFSLDEYCFSRFAKIQSLPKCSPLF